MRLSPPPIDTDYAMALQGNEGVADLFSADVAQR